MKLLKKIDHNILSLLGMYAVVLIAMAILNPSTYYSTLNIKSWIYLFPEYGILIVTIASQLLFVCHRQYLLLQECTNVGQPYCITYLSQLETPAF